MSLFGISLRKAMEYEKAKEKAREEREERKINQQLSLRKAMMAERARRERIDLDREKLAQREDREARLMLKQEQQEEKIKAMTQKIRNQAALAEARAKSLDYVKVSGGFIDRKASEKMGKPVVIPGPMVVQNYELKKRRVKVMEDRLEISKFNAETRRKLAELKQNPDKYEAALKEIDLSIKRLRLKDMQFRQYLQQYGAMDKRVMRLGDLMKKREEMKMALQLAAAFDQNSTEMNIEESLRGIDSLIKNYRESDTYKKVQNPPSLRKQQETLRPGFVRLYDHNGQPLTVPEEKAAEVLKQIQVLKGRASGKK